MSDDTVHSKEEQAEYPIDPEYIQHLSEEFDTLCQLRHEAGAEEYGEVAFLTAPLVKMAAEELADMAIYCRFMYVKLRLMEDFLDASGIDLSSGPAPEVRSPDEVPPGPASFIPGEKVSGFLSGEKQS